MTLKIGLAQLNFHVGNFTSNYNKILDAINTAINQGIDLIVFPELAVCGYPAWDFLEFKEFVDDCESIINNLIPLSTKIGIIIGSPTRNPNLEGKNLHNSAIFMSEGKVNNLIHKHLLPTYDVFDEYRYFEPANLTQCVEFKGIKIALTICEDLWNLDDDPLYTTNPMDLLIKENPEIAINLAASPFSFTHPEDRLKVLKRNAHKYQIPFYYVNHVGAQTELIFDGGSCLIYPDGQIKGLSYFSEGVFSPENENKALEMPSKYDFIYQALILGIQDYFKKLGFSKAILGLSGGIDSAVVYVLLVKALGADNVFAIEMPSPYTSSISNTLAQELVNNCSGKESMIEIKSIMESIEKSLENLFYGLPKGLTEENIQSRIRGLLLMAISNKFGNILVNTSNKSEMAVGYSTLYGDSNGAFSVLGDLYKTEVYELAQYLNQKFDGLIPELIITRPPSAELRPDQKDSDSLPEYDILDKLLYNYIELKKGPLELESMGFEKSIIDRILSLVNKSEFKRFQAPPILRVSNKAFGVGRRLPIVAKYL